MIVENPFTGEVIDTDGSVDQWGGTALRWIAAYKAAKQMEQLLRVELARAAGANKRYVSVSGFAFAKRPARRSYAADARRQAFELQQSLPEAFHVVKEKVDYEVSTRALDKLRRASGEVPDQIVRVLDAAQNPAGAPSIDIEALEEEEQNES